MANLLWFHSFDRKKAQDELGDIVDVLMNGAPVSNDPDSKTPGNEKVLRIDPRRVYAYLGRPHEQFGENIVALEGSSLDALAGHMSPFDTGGLVKHFKPVADLDDAAKADYLALFTWDTSQRGTVIGNYPGADKAQIEDYLDCKRPEVDGPYVVLARDDHRSNGLAKSPIWKENTGAEMDWRLWTWEGRVPGRLPATNLVKWTCASSHNKAVISALTKRMSDARNAGDQATEDRVRAIVGSFVTGGLSALVTKLRSEQAA